jgi:hypothetical protein
MNALICESKSQPVFPADDACPQPIVADAYAVVRDVQSRHRADRLVININAMFEDKRATPSKPNATMAVALTARQLVSPRGARPAGAVPEPMDQTPTGER